MDWLQGMNDVIEYIEKNLGNTIKYESLSKIVGCSTYEFSRIFSFIAGMSISEYIRRRRLSQAVFDIQNGEEKIEDIALKYCYESQASFTRAFKELHDQTPLSARKSGISLKTYPKITFKLTIRGVGEMNFRIEPKNSFKILGFSCANGDAVDWDTFMVNYNMRLRNGDAEMSYYKPPFWQVGAYWFETAEGENKCIIGAELTDKPVLDGMNVKTVPSATWAIFTIASKVSSKEVENAYARIFTESFPESSYMRDEKVPSLEVYGTCNANSQDYQWEVWVPVIKK